MRGKKEGGKGGGRERRGRRLGSVVVVMVMIMILGVLESLGGDYYAGLSGLESFAPGKGKQTRRSSVYNKRCSNSNGYGGGKQR
jgi:hypothetical protein